MPEISIFLAQPTSSAPAQPSLAWPLTRCARGRRPHGYRLDDAGRFLWATWFHGLENLSAGQWPQCGCVNVALTGIRPATKRELKPRRQFVNINAHRVCPLGPVAPL